jgi:hypothetical protein
MGRREELLAAEERGWGEVGSLVRGLDASHLEVAGVGEQRWTAKDLMWHVACWSAEASSTFERIRAGSYDGGHEAWDDTDELNARWLEVSRGLDVLTVKAAWYASRTRLVEGFGAFAEPDADAVEWFEESGPNHYAEHLSDLRGFVERLEGRAGEMGGAGSPEGSSPLPDPEVDRP